MTVTGETTVTWERSRKDLNIRGRAIPGETIEAQQKFNDHHDYTGDSDSGTGVDHPGMKGFLGLGWLLYKSSKKRTRKDSNLRGQRPADFKSAPLTTPALVPLRLLLRPWIEHGASRSSVLRSPNWAIEANTSLTQCGDWTHDHTIKSRALYQLS